MSRFKGGPHLGQRSPISSCSLGGLTNHPSWLTYFKHRFGTFGHLMLPSSWEWGAHPDEASEPLWAPPENSWCPPLGAGSLDALLLGRQLLWVLKQAVGQERPGVQGSGWAMGTGGCLCGWTPRGLKVQGWAPPGGGEHILGLTGDCTRELGAEAEEKGGQRSRAGGPDKEGLHGDRERGPGPMH